MRTEVLEAVERGEIEAVFNVDVWYEGADLYMFTHLIGARPTFSRFKKGQERGRVNRRGPDDVSTRGELLSDKPKIIFDLVDHYRTMDRHLMQYGDLMNVPDYTRAQLGELYDVLTSQVTAEMDRTGKGVIHSNKRTSITGQAKAEKPGADMLLHPVAAKLWEILETRYAGDVDPMALDLGISMDQMQEILEGRGWIDARWFLRRIATLLYQEDRDILLDLYNEERGLRDEKITGADISVLLGALAVYEEREGPLSQTLVIEGTLGNQSVSATLAKDPLRSLSMGTLSEEGWRRIWRGLALYFSGYEEGQGEFQKLRHHLFMREGWSEEAKTAGEKLLLAAREGVALKFGGKLPTFPGIEGVPVQSMRGVLTCWIKGEKIKFSRRIPSGHFYQEVRSLMIGLGIDKNGVNTLIVDAVFEQEGWDRKNDTPGEKLLLTAREAMASRFGGRLPTHAGIEGVPNNTPKLSLTRWMQGEKIEFTRNLTESNFYHQVRSLMVGLGVDKKRADELIVDVVFEQEDWPWRTDTAQQRLLLAARQSVALKFGGRIPRTSDIEGIARQTSEGFCLSLWLKSGEIKRRGYLFPQVRALLLHENYMAPEEADRLIAEASREE